MSNKCQLISQALTRNKQNMSVHRNDVKRAVDLLYSVKMHCKRFSEMGICNERLLINNIITSINVLGFDLVVKHTVENFDDNVVEFLGSVLKYVDLPHTLVQTYNPVFYDYIILNNQ